MYEIGLCAFNFYCRICIKAAWRKMVRNCLFFADSHLEMLLKAIGQLLGAAEKNTGIGNHCEITSGY